MKLFFPFWQTVGISMMPATHVESYRERESKDVFLNVAGQDCYFCARSKNKSHALPCEVRERQLQEKEEEALGRKRTCPH